MLNVTIHMLGHSSTQQTICSSTQHPSAPQCQQKWEHLSAPEVPELVPVFLPLK